MKTSAALPSNPLPEGLCIRQPAGYQLKRTDTLHHRACRRPIGIGNRGQLPKRGAAVAWPTIPWGRLRGCCRGRRRRHRPNSASQRGTCAWGRSTIVSGAVGDAGGLLPWEQYVGDRNVMPAVASGPTGGCAGCSGCIQSGDAVSRQHLLRCESRNLEG